ncbi:hypothetical protein F5J12DRAFT_781685 [Pisolithus orientalis]|uniref:uncharacterized protein n=1 Tax=Pisolithus orientalis TaxID=936130 RepID=UPI0022247FBA|nr:uncharacterized protein F5J12DRAFT_781685 [Pisolithus orientalis]KAI6010668.1 hypothetical protein F5J12DRAFT_781685 [Pisolithus orientalis]
MLTHSHTCFPSLLSTLHSRHQSYTRGTLGASPTKHQGLGALDDSRRLGAFESCLDETPSHGGATSYSATQGVEDCQLSLATLESIFYFPNKTQLFTLPTDKTLFTLPVGTPIGFLLLTFLLSWLSWHSLHHLLRLMVFHGYPQLHLVHLRQDSFTFPAAFSPLSIMANGLPWLPPVLSSPSDTRVFQFACCTFSSTSITLGECLVHPPPSARGLVPLAALKGLEPSKVILLCCLCFCHSEPQTIIFFTWGTQ